MRLANLIPSPVMLTVPTMMPAQAQAAAIPTVFRPAATSDSQKTVGPIRVEALIRLRTMSIPMAEKAARAGLNPMVSTTIRVITGNMKIHPSESTFDVLGISSSGIPSMPVRQASKWTFMNRLR